MARLALSIVALLVMAGCTGSPQPESDETSDAAGRMARPPSFNATSDTLYLATLPHMTTAFPNSAGPQSTAFPQQASSDSPPFLRWEHQLTTSGSLLGGNATIWVAVPANSVFALPNPSVQSCPWDLLLSVRSPSGELHGVGSTCPSRDAGIHPGGEATIEFTIAQGSGIDFDAGDLLVLQVMTWWVPPPGSSVVVKHGDDPYASHIQLKGLAERLEEVLSGIDRRP